jgi:hypothetical protein
MNTDFMRVQGDAVNRTRSYVCLAAAFMCAGTPAEAATGAHRDGPLNAAAEPVPAIRTLPAPGDCAFDVHHPDNRHLKTGYQQGVARSTMLVAMFVPCAALEKARAGSSGVLPWLPEWVTVEANGTPVEPEDRTDTFKTVAKLCRDARVGHPAPMAPTFDAMVAKGHAALDSRAAVVHFGVVGEEPGLCYLASLRAETSPAGVSARLLTVTAFMVTARQWVYHSMRRQAVPGEAAEPMLELAKTAARDFLAANPCQGREPCAGLNTVRD